MFSGKTLTEKELVLDLMASEEHLTSSYNNGVIDSSCPVLREVLSGCLLKAHNIQYSLFDLSERKGWNKVHLANNREVVGIVEKYSNFI
ncbi:spore coat protein [Sporosalibacterium faouarense]|uniref:spore coat protein n=1 Tax=Sporosalibacterium faouarense TaxID=516123 RepID=UPI00141CF11E|nr:spore coat protein [Sporosalibacterium faouarense]MTI46746.1 spore coat protein [Bacillota bacterium]